MFVFFFKKNFIKSNECSEDSYMVLADFFSRKKSQNIDALRYNARLSSIEINLLKVMQIALSKNECGNGAKKREQFFVSKKEFCFYISS